MVYLFSCDLSYADYVGYTAGHLHQHKNSAIVKHLLEAHGGTPPQRKGQFRILRKCQGKFDCLVYEMLCIKERNPSLNTQTDSILSNSLSDLHILTHLLFLFTINTNLSTIILT